LDAGEQPAQFAYSPPLATCFKAFRPIYVSRADTLVDGTAEQNLLHNETGARLCHWYPAR